MSFIHKSIIPVILYMIWFGLITFFDRQEIWFLALTGLMATGVTFVIVKLFPAIKPKKAP